MPQLIHYNYDELPYRNELLEDIEEKVKPEQYVDDEELLFHGFDIRTINKYKVYERRVKNYSVLITGILTDGSRANLIIEDIPIFFDVRLISNTLHEKKQIEKIVEEAISTRNNIKWEEIYMYPGVGFSKEKKPYLRFYFDTQWDRKNALKSILNSRNKYETASDVDGNLIQSIIIQYEWTFGDWSLVKNFDYNYDKKSSIHLLFISDPDDFIANIRPLSSEQPKKQTPSIPIYFHIPMDIEVNGISDILPNVSNKEEKIFMLSGGIYRSDKPENPLVSFTITHMDCMEDNYIDYMKSDRRKDFMKDDRPDWILIITKNEEETLIAYADILGKIQPEFRSQFNGYSFDDPYIVTRIHQYNKLSTFIKKLSIVPHYYTEFGLEEKDKESKELFKNTLRETHIKLEAGVFDMGDNRKRLDYLGSINVDIMCAMKKANPTDDLLIGHALRAYLDRYGLPKKIDMSINDMNRYYKEEDGLGLLEAADYCTVDSLSCQRIQNKVSLFQSYLALAHIALCTPSDSILRAGGMKVKNVIYCFGKRLELVYSENTIPEQIESRYPGAIVFPPVRGRYTEVPTIALDFSSLYPSIMQALWTSSETYIDVDKSPKFVKKIEDEGYDVYHFNPNWKYEAKDDKGNVIEKVISRNVAFVRHNPDGSTCLGVYPKCLEFLTNIRKMYKKKMSKAMDNVARLEKEGETKELFEARLTEKEFNQKQLAVKIISNTIYGQLGSTRFNLYNPFIASTITLTGQKLITAASDVAINKGFMRLYGDSFTGSTPVIIKQNDKIQIIRVDELIDEDKWETRIDGKQYYDFDGLEIWEINKFVKANQIIRHKTNKEIVRVNTHCGVADVTLDHSLFKSDGTKISPNDIVVTSGNKWKSSHVLNKEHIKGTELLTTEFDNLLQDFKDNEKDFGITEDLAWMLGMFGAEGHASIHKRSDGRGYGYCWRIYNSDTELLERCKQATPYDTKIVHTRGIGFLDGKNCTKDMYRLEIISNGKKGGVSKPTLEYRKLFYNKHSEKKVPMEILYSSKKIAEAFLEGFYEGDGAMTASSTQITQKGKESIMGLILLIKKCEYKHYSIYYKQGIVNKDLYTIHYNDKLTMKSPNVVKKKTTLYEEYNDFVYDFNTETGKHHIGCGNLICSNTDSCFLLPSVEMMNGTTVPAEKVKICQSLAEDVLLPDIHTKMREITKRDIDVIKMELDKLLYPAVYCGKKRYAGIIYEGDKKPSLYISGLEYKKRGKSKLLVDLSEEIVDILLDLDNNEIPKDTVLKVFKSGIDRIQKEPISYFVKQAKFRTGKEGFISLFISRMKELALYDPILYELPKPNTVFEYVVTNKEHTVLHNGNKRTLKKSDKMEFRHVVEQSNYLKPDYAYYIEDVVGALARFICFDDEFNDSIDNTDMDIIDKKSNENAKKFLIENMKTYMGIISIHYTIIKRQIKKVNAEHNIQYGDMLDILHYLFDKEIRIDNICNCIIHICREVPSIEFEDDRNIEQEIKELEDYIHSRKGKLEGIYGRYLKDIELASRRQVEDINIFKKSPKMSSSTKQIIDTIETLKYFNSIKDFAIEQKEDEDHDILYILKKVFN